MNKQGYVIARAKKADTFFTTSSAYDRPQWVNLQEATVFPTADLAQQAAKKLWKYGAYSAGIQQISELFDDTPEEDMVDDASAEDSAYGADGELDDAPISAMDAPEAEDSAYGADGELEGDDIEAMDDDPCPECDEVPCVCPGAEDSAYGADGELEGDDIEAMDNPDAEIEGDGVSMSFEMPDEEDPEMSDRRSTMEALEGERTFQTYAAWKRAVKAIDAAAEFYGDKEIGGAKGIGERDGETGVIFDKETLARWANKKKDVTEGVLTEISKNTLSSYLKKATADITKKREKALDSWDKYNTSADGSVRRKSAKEFETSQNAAEKRAENVGRAAKKLAKAYEAIDTVANAHEVKVSVPASVKSALKKVIDEHRASAKEKDTRDDVCASQCLTVADALQQLHDDLSKGTVEGLKQAQIHMTSYMTPITQHIPAEVVKFIATGGEEKKSLQNLFSSIKESKKEDFDAMAAAWDADAKKETNLPEFNVTISSDSGSKTVMVKAEDEKDAERKGKHFFAKLSNPRIVKIVKMR